MLTFDVRLFQVSRSGDGAPPVPTELPPLTVQAVDADCARDALVASLTDQGHKIRSITFGPNPAGRVGLVAYVWTGVE